MSLNGIMGSALSALQTNQAALSVVSNNVSNVNTQGYARRVVNEETLSAGGTLQGVDIASIQRVVDQYLNQETLSASASSSYYDTQSTTFSQLDALLGQPGDGNAITSQLSDVFSAIGQAVLSPTSSASQSGIVDSLQSLAAQVSNLSASITSLQGQTDSQVASSVGTVNSLLQQIYNLNQQIHQANAGGDAASALLDQRDQALQSLSQLIDVRTVANSDGTVKVMTQDGVNLVSNTYAQLSYTASGVAGTYQPITIQDYNPATGAAIGSPQTLDPHLTGGSIKGMIDMRDGTLADVQNELGSLAGGIADAFNAQSNASSAFPPPASLTGADTGLLSTDALNFTGDTTIAVADSSGNLVSRIDVDFDNGTLTVDGGAPQPIGTTVGDFANALNAALGTNGSASFADGKLSISAAGGDGIVVQDDAADPTSRGGTPFSQFFGLNDIFQSSVPFNTATGLSAGDDSGLQDGGEIDLQLRDANGGVIKEGTVDITAGMTVGDVVDALNTAMGGAETFTLNADGSITAAPSSGNSGATLQVTTDTTQRGTTGISFTELFGIGADKVGAKAASFSVNPSLVSEPGLFPFATPAITGTSAAGDSIVTHGDTSGLNAYQNLASAQQSFAQVGSLGAQVSSLGDYAGALYQDVATRGQSIQSNQTAQDDRLTEAQSRQSQVSGVNLDEELSNMIIYQQAYAAGARMLTTVDQLYQTLLGIQ